MAKKKKPSSVPTTSKQWQKRIERLDRELIQLLNERAAAAQELERISAGDRPERVGVDPSMLDELDKANRGPLPTASLQAVFRELASGIDRLARPVRVCYLGPEFSYSHLAAVQKFGASAELVPVATIPSVFDSFDRQQADFGLVPIENSTDGRVADTLEMFTRRPVRICGEVPLRIHHHLLGKCRQSEVKEVHSKPQALSQCRTWLAQHLPDAQMVETTSTTAAARVAVERPGAAAIASRQAGVNYGLKFIAENIEDNRNNITRFGVIGNGKPKRTGRDKTSLMFELPHSPGALADAMAIFKRNRLNLTWIESFPMPETPNEYLFFVEFQGHPDELRAKRALSALSKKTVVLEVLGSYPVAEVID